MKSKILVVSMRGFFCFLIVVVLMLTPMVSKGETKEIDEKDLYAGSAVLIDGRSGRILYEKNAENPMPMASTTKIMTCIIVLENCQLSEEVEISSYAASMPKVKLQMKKGENYQAEDLLHSLMLESHNDSAVALAEHVGNAVLVQQGVKNYENRKVSDHTLDESKEAVKAFAKLMNEKAQKIGCKNTYFITPNGLDATETYEFLNEKVVKEHRTTALELAKIMAYCINESPAKEEFLRITQRREYTFSANNRQYHCYNHNALLQTMPGIISGKTGFTNKAGYCYVGAWEEEERQLIVALLACGWPNNKNYKWHDTKMLMTYGKNEFHWYPYRDVKAAARDKILPPITVTMAKTMEEGHNMSVEVRIEDNGTTDDRGILLKAGEKIEIKWYLAKKTQAPVDRGDTVGKVQYLLGDRVLLEENIVIAEDAERISYSWCLHRIGNIYVKFNNKYAYSE